MMTHPLPSHKKEGTSQSLLIKSDAVEREELEFGNTWPMERIRIRKGN